MRLARIAGALFAAAVLTVGALTPIPGGGSMPAVAASGGCGSGSGPVCWIGTSCTYYYSLAMAVCGPAYRYYYSSTGGTGGDDSDEAGDPSIQYEP